MPGSLANALVLLTRPKGRNEPLMQRLASKGLESLVLPVLDIVPVPAALNPPPVPGGYDLVVFVSGNAVNCYFRQLNQAGAMPAAWPEHTRVAAVGAATAKAVLDTGFVPAECILAPHEAESQDSESLWKYLQALTAAMSRALIVRGQEGREWLGLRLEQAGVEVIRHISYERRTLEWPASIVRHLRGGLDSGRPVICLLTSAHGVTAFIDNAARHDLLPACLGFHYVVIHPRIAARLQSSLESSSASGKVGDLAVTICPPGEDAIVQAVFSLASR
ncbi:uroporphyrinogen-III synthase [Pusillimonas sp.]|uniref:uroporphyrinogen-III synthase n=1 Tax=Pusillimonas sp. TaxID=3040095 RepID=UPI0037C6830F